MRERGQGDAKPIVLRVSAGRGPNPSLYADGRGGRERRNQCSGSKQRKASKSSCSHGFLRRLGHLREHVLQVEVPLHVPILQKTGAKSRGWTWAPKPRPTALNHAPTYRVGSSP